ncbi:MAG: hypothetical protein AB1481_04535 [Candidatus Omnitrophota bacterium]
MQAVRGKRYFLAFFILVITLLFVSAEIILRGKGYPARSKVKERVPFFELDSVLCWKNKPGQYYWPGPQDKVTIWLDTSRAVQPEPRERKESIVMLGGSYVFGWLIRDQETFIWKMQQEFPLIDLRNCGVCGYGTYQSLLFLRRLLASGPAPVLVVYGFDSSQEERNVASWNLLSFLMQATDEVVDRKIEDYFPYCSLGKEGSLREGRINLHSGWPFRNKLATSSFLRDLYMQFARMRDTSSAQTVTKKLLLEMNKLCEEKGAKFAVALLDFREEEKSRYIRFFQEGSISFIDCINSEFTLMKSDTIQGGHPGAEINSHWAQCLGRYIRERIMLDK